VAQVVHSTASAILVISVAVARHAAYSTVGYGESDYADLDIAPIGAVKSPVLRTLACS